MVLFEKTKTMAQQKKKTNQEILAELKDEMMQVELFTGKNAKIILVHILKEKGFESLCVETFAEKFKVTPDESKSIINWLYKNEKIDEALSDAVKRVFRHLLTIVPLTDESSGIWHNMCMRTGILFEDIKNLLNPICAQVRAGFFGDKNFMKSTT